MQTGMLGNLALVLRDVWDVNITYKRNDVVTHDDKLWGAKADIPTGTEPGTSPEWMILLEGGSGGSGGDLPLFALLPSFFSTVEDGYLSVCVDNGILSGDPASVTYPAFPGAYTALEARKTAGDIAIRTMQEYADSMTAIGKAPFFAIDTVTKTFRIPCAPGLFWRGMMAGKNVGDYGIDQIRPIEAAAGLETYANSQSLRLDMTGAFYYNTEMNSNIGWINSPSPLGKGRLGFNSALLGPHFNGDQTVPEHVIVDYQIRMYGAVTDAGTIQLSQLIAAMAGKLDTSVFEQWKTSSAPLLGQSWQDVTSLRSNNIIYQNTSGRPLAIAIDFSGGSGQYFGFWMGEDSGNLIRHTQFGVAGIMGNYFTIVPDGWYYRGWDSATVRFWREYR